MYCTKCGIELRSEDKFCSQCGRVTSNPGVFYAPPGVMPRLSRPVPEAKLGGVCAGFARYFGVDVTLVRILWCVFSIWPLPIFGVIAYLVAWVVMPRDPLLLPAATVQTTSELAR